MQEIIGIEDIKEEWVIDSDSKAEWSLKKLQEEQVELQRYINICERLILEYEYKIKKVKERHEQSTSFLKGKLFEYFNSVKVKETKTQKSYKLPTATLKLKVQQPEIVKNEEKLLEYVKANSTEFLKVKETVDWVELKKKLIFENDKVIDENGQILDCVTLVNRQPKFEIEFE